MSNTLKNVFKIAMAYAVLSFIIYLEDGVDTIKLIIPMLVCVHINSYLVFRLKPMITVIESKITAHIMILLGLVINTSVLGIAAYEDNYIMYLYCWVLPITFLGIIKLLRKQKM